ncbi:MAG: hypothetical protein ACI9TY_001173 [Alphaproteobacteria bacterium]|jgi:hypothetical protein
MSLDYIKALAIYNTKLENLGETVVTDELVAQKISEIEAVFDEPEKVGWQHNDGRVLTLVYLGSFTVTNRNKREFTKRIYDAVKHHVDKVDYIREQGQKTGRCIHQYSTGCYRTNHEGEYQYRLDSFPDEKAYLEPDYDKCRAIYMQIAFLPEFLCK